MIDQGTYDMYGRTPWKLSSKYGNINMGNSFYRQKQGDGKNEKNLYSDAFVWMQLKLHLLL